MTRLLYDINHARRYTYIQWELARDGFARLRSIIPETGFTGRKLINTHTRARARTLSPKCLNGRRNQSPKNRTDGRADGRTDGRAHVLCGTQLAQKPVVRATEEHARRIHQHAALHTSNKTEQPFVCVRLEHVCVWRCSVTNRINFRLIYWNSVIWRWRAAPPAGYT